MSTRRNLVFRFSASERNGGTVIHTFDEKNAEREALEIMARSSQPRGGFLSSIQPRKHLFSDLGYYQCLCAEPDCVSVQISRVRCLCSRYFMGIEVVYRSTFTNGTTKESEAPKRSFTAGYYSLLGGEPEANDLELEDDEFITGLHLNQGAIMDGVTFVTNRREVHFGGYGGSTHDRTLSNNLDMFRIVAFTGTASGVMHRIGFFAEGIPWGAVRSVVMLRWLVEQNRAAPRDAEVTQEQLVVRALVGGVLPNDIFEEVLKFLIPK
jgi:hypothetical protein